ncbi:hypothetical protein Cgig2_011562 [Carnegiea gigantea]|uniref:Protein BZR1 homolog n=1 Tax=Carnegiea gigantea TaxID=171969 RepID=A0A9Q1JKC1_9CARY|nr:hypothetical protein Cgig2_011562 [Carnegiea gigantea]
MEEMMMMEGKNSKNKMRGCIKSSRGPWVVHRRTNKGVVTSLRFPTERERQNNKERERRRRDVTRRIYAGLRAHGNYKLPKYADNNDVLRALCHEAGWLVDEDGAISRKNVVTETARLSSTISGQISGGGVPSTNGGCIEEPPAEEANLTLSLCPPSWDWGWTIKDNLMRHRTIQFRIESNIEG